MGTHNFFDLSVADTQLEPETQKERIAIALSLGYNGLATPYQAGTKLNNATDRCTIRRVAGEEILAATRGLKPNPQIGTADPHKLKQQLTRINIPVEDTNEAQETFSNSSVLGSYDLVAALPQNERAFAFSCTSLNTDLICVDLTKRMSYRFRPDLIKTAMQRGVYFEILYAPILREPGSRRQIFTNAQALTRETRGRGIVLSSGARTAIELRGPYDVVNLGTFLGLTEQQAHAAVGKNAVAVVEHARKRKSYRGTLSIRGFRPGTEDDALLLRNNDTTMATEEQEELMETDS